MCFFFSFFFFPSFDMNAYNKSLVGKNRALLLQVIPRVDWSIRQAQLPKRTLGIMVLFLLDVFFMLWKRNKTFACCCLMDASCLFIPFFYLLYSKANVFFLTVLGFHHALEKMITGGWYLIFHWKGAQTFKALHLWVTLKQMWCCAEIIDMSNNCKASLPSWKYFWVWTWNGKKESWKKKKNRKE